MMKVTLIGAGNVATQLGKALKKAGIIINQVYSRTEISAKMLGELLETEWLTDITKLRDDAEIYILSVKDSVLCDLISEVCKGREDKLFLHTAGSMPMSCFEGKAQHYGVFYPMQTFSKAKDVNFKTIPVFIEGNSALFLPIGLGLYWWIGLLFMIVQQIFVNVQAEKQKQKGEIVTRK